MNYHWHVLSNKQNQGNKVASWKDNSLLQKLVKVTVGKPFMRWVEQRLGLITQFKFLCFIQSRILPSSPNKVQIVLVASSWLTLSIFNATLLFERRYNSCLYSHSVKIYRFVMIYEQLTSLYILNSSIKHNSKYLPKLWEAEWMLFWIGSLIAE